MEIANIDEIIDNIYENNIRMDKHSSFEAR
jgi:hypothetical protein